MFRNCIYTVHGLIVYARFFIIFSSAQTIWELGSKAENPHEFTVSIDESDLQSFGFTDDFIFDMWGAISDAKSGRLNKAAEFNEQF